MSAIARVLASERGSDSVQASSQAARAHFLFWIGLAPCSLGMLGILFGIPALFYDNALGVASVIGGVLLILASLPILWHAQP